MTDVQQQILIEQRISNDAKSPVVAYLLWLFVGGLGGHRFYLGKIKSACGILALTIFGWLTIAIGIGFVLLAAMGIWLLIDAFLIPGIVAADKTRIRESMTRAL